MAPTAASIDEYISTFPEASWAMSVSAQLLALVWRIDTAARPSLAGRIGEIERESGNAVSTLKRSVIGCEG